MREFVLERGDAGVVVVVVAARRREVHLASLEVILRVRHLDRERIEGGLALLELRDFFGANGELSLVLRARREILVELGELVEVIGVLDVQLVLLLARLLELIVLVLELVLEVGDDLVVVRAREVLASAAVANLEELLAGVDDGLLQILHLLLERHVVFGERLVVLDEPLDLLVEIVELRERIVGDVVAAHVLVVLALSEAMVDAGSCDALGVRDGGRGRVPVRLARVRHLVGVLAAVLERADAAVLCGVGSAEAREATPHGDGDGVRRGGGHDAGADEQRADGHGPAVADGPRPRAPLALLTVHEGRALVREEGARHLVRRCAVHHGAGSPGGIDTELVASGRVARLSTPREGRKRT
mmetsp:Transcript_5320/g.21752  ORF Transcript_5320/g.21752 Transcript_5320/m.21752 type:complete len:358 (-) Transcript_5320:73-1146(-)